MATEPPSQENARDEYKLVFEGYKFFVSIRFIVAAFAMSIQSALLTIFNQAVKENHLNGSAIFGLAMLFLSALLIIELRTTILFSSLLNRGSELELQLGNIHGFFHRIAELSRQKGLRQFITHTWGIRLVYAGMFILWVMLLVVTVTKKPESAITPVPVPEPKKEKVDVTRAYQFQSAA